jgi:hypothetical protein
MYRNASKVKSVRKGAWIKHTSVYEWKMSLVQRIEAKNWSETASNIHSSSGFHRRKSLWTAVPVLISVILSVDTNILEV